MAALDGGGNDGSFFEERVHFVSHLVSMPYYHHCLYM